MLFVTLVLFSLYFFGHPQLNADIQKQQKEKEASERHIEQLDEKIQQLDAEKGKVGEQRKKCVLVNVSTEVFFFAWVFIFLQKASILYIKLLFCYDYSSAMTQQWVKTVWLSGQRVGIAIQWSQVQVLL